MNKTTNELFAFQNSAQRERDLEKHKFKILKAYKEGSVTGLAAKEEQKRRFFLPTSRIPPSGSHLMTGNLPDTTLLVTVLHLAVNP